MKKGDMVLYLAVVVLLFDFVSPIPGDIKFAISVVLVVAIVGTAIARIVSGLKNKQTPKE